MLKRFLRSDGARRAAVALVILYLRLCYATTRWTVVADDERRRLHAAGLPFILAFWHGRVGVTPACWDRRYPVDVLISQHRDGELIARTIAAFGLGAVRGSTQREGKRRDKGGAAALRQMLRRLKEGVSVAISPDGPRGPRMRASDGIVTVARLSGARIVAVGCASRPGVQLGTWDRFLVPLPFARGAQVWSEPVDVPRDGDAETLERLRLAVEERLNRATAEADRLVGRRPVAPAEPER